MGFLHNCWYVAAGAEEATAKPFARTFLDKPVVIYRGDSGGLVAMDDRCPHRFARLHQGRVIGDAIQCPYHGLTFGPRGSCVHVPSGDAAPPRARLQVYPIIERYNLLWIWMGDPALADVATIPDFSYLEDPQFGWFNGYLHVKGHYELLVDNLLDLSHGEFLHPLLASEGWCARNKQTVTQNGETILVGNIAYDDNMSPLFRQLRPDLPPIGTMIQEERWDAPSLLRLYFEFHSGGDKIIIPSGHFLTPETESTTHYIVRAGHQGEIHNPAVTAGYKAGVMGIFQSEDVPMIEEQQRFLGNANYLDHEPAILKSDGPAIRARRLLARKIRQEQTGPVLQATAAAG